MIGGLDI